jgi:hypothetical protein
MKISNLGTKISGSLIAASAYLASANVAHAQLQGRVGTIPIPSGGNLSDLIYRIINIALGAIGLVAVVYLIWGGVTYITAGGDAEKAGKGRVAITNAVIGILIVISALVIYNAVISAGRGQVNDFNSI